MKNLICPECGQRRLNSRRTSGVVCIPLASIAAAAALPSRPRSRQSRRDRTMKARILASILAQTIKLLLKRHGCPCLECIRARANLKMIEEEFRPKPIVTRVARILRMPL